MNLDEKMTMFRYAKPEDFKVGLTYQIVEPYGREWNFFQREVRSAFIAQDAVDFRYHCDQRKAIVPKEDVMSGEYMDAAREIMAEKEIQELLKEYKPIQDVTSSTGKKPEASN